MSLTARTRTLSGKFTADEESRVKAAAGRLTIDVSAFMRRAALHELEDKPIDASEALLELFVRTMECSLELGDGFTVERFRQLCADVKANGNGAAKEA